jgi:rhamnosyltransferase subunit B
MRVLVTAFGSAGDLYPHIGLSLGLQARGHVVRFASHAHYRGLVESAGLPFAAVRPDYPRSGNEAQLMRQAVSGSTFGLPRLFQHFYIPHLPETFADLLAAAEGVDGVVAACNTLAAPFVAQRLKRPWATSVIAPFMFGSRLDFPIIPVWPRTSMWLKEHGKSGRFFTLALHLDVWRWMRGVGRFGRSIGIPVLGHPMYAWPFSPCGSLGLFPHLLAPSPPSDWPPHVRVTGFIPWQGTQADRLPADLAAFLDAGEAPVVFTLGTWAVGVGLEFYRRSAEACLRLGQRAVLLVGTDPAIREGLPVSPLLHVAEYAPHAALFPRARLVVNHGGIGSFSQTLLAKRPMIIVPHGLDQFDNAYRLRRQGLAAMILPDEYTVDHLVAILRAELENSARAAVVARAGAEFAAHDGVAAACVAVEEMLKTQHRSDRHV